MYQYKIIDKILPVLAFLLVVPVCSVMAEMVKVVRDGSLVFASPDNSSAVLDILSRGATLELLEEGTEWHLVLSSDGGEQGYIRSESVSKSIVPSSYNPDSVRVGSQQYLQLQRSLDEAQAKIRRISETLERLDGKVAAAETAEMRMADGPAGSRPGAGAEAGGMMGEDARKLAVTAFYGMALENTDFAAGLSAAWFPGLPAGLGIEFEAGAQFPENVDNAYWGQVGLRYPLADWDRVMPYMAAGGGLVRRSYSTATSVEITDNNPLATAGGGLIIKLAGPVALQADVRYSWEFATGETIGDGRAYIGATLLR